jgi:hypothetical protein
MAKKILTKGELLNLEVHIENLMKNFGLSKETFNEVKTVIDKLYPTAPNDIN